MKNGKKIDTIKVYIVDDHQIFIDGLTGILEDFRNIEVVGSSNSGEEAITNLSKTEAHVVILDITMQKMDGYRCAEIISMNFPTMKILTLSMNDDLGSIKKMLNAGAHGYIFKNVQKLELEKAINQVYKEGSYLNPEILQLLLTQQQKPNERDHTKLTKREIEVLKLIAEGNQNSEISEKLHISLFTVKSHRKNILSKLNLRNTADMVRYAVNNSLI